MLNIKASKYAYILHSIASATEKMHRQVNTEKAPGMSAILRFCLFVFRMFFPAPTCLLEE